MTSALGFKARVDPLLACFLRFTSGATPVDCVEVSMVASRIPHMLQEGFHRDTSRTVSGRGKRILKCDSGINLDTSQVVSQIHPIISISRGAFLLLLPISFCVLHETKTRSSI